MNKEKEIKDISHLIIKHLSGEASPEEKERLEQWRNSSEANERLFQKLTALQGASKTYGHYRAAKEANDWLALRKKSHRKRASLLYRWMRYAAVACIIGIVGYYILNQHTGEKELPLATAIKPGVSKAILQLANGKEIFLDKQKKSQEILLGHYGISESESMLSYDKAEKIEEFHTLKVPQGGEYMLQLDGGSKVWVNAGSVIKYPVHFSTHERRVYLLEGEAYFEVARDEKRPFFVETSDVSVHVLYRL